MLYVLQKLIWYCFCDWVDELVKTHLNIYYGWVKGSNHSCIKYKWEWYLTSFSDLLKGTHTIASVTDEMGRAMKRALTGVSKLLSVFFLLYKIRWCKGKRIFFFLLIGFCNWISLTTGGRAGQCSAKQTGGANLFCWLSHLIWVSCTRWVKEESLGGYFQIPCSLKQTRYAHWPDPARCLFSSCSLRVANFDITDSSHSAVPAVQSCLLLFLENILCPRVL